MFLFFKKNSGIILILVLALLPIAIWTNLASLPERFSGLGTITNSLGQIAGLLGISLFSISLILSAKLNGKIGRYHCQIGAISFSLLLFHPLLLVAKYLQFSVRSAALFFLPNQTAAMNLGIISLLLMIFIMMLTFYIKLKYQNWKMFHKFMIAIFIIAVLHSVLIPSDISRNIVLRSYILTLAFLALTAGSYRAFLFPFLKKS